MTELAIQFYPIRPSLIISVLFRGRGKNFPRSWANPTLNLDSLGWVYLTKVELACKVSASLDLSFLPSRVGKAITNNSIDIEFILSWTELGKNHRDGMFLWLNSELFWLFIVMTSHNKYSSLIFWQVTITGTLVMTSQPLSVSFQHWNISIKITNFPVFISRQAQLGVPHS